MEDAFDKIKTNFTKNKREILFVSLILLLAAFLRLYKIREFVIFLGDEGRDVLVVKRMIVDHKWTLLGPTASVGGFYLGPIYYYFMIPFLLAFRFDPVGPAVMVALIGTATVALIYWTAKSWFGKSVGLLTTALYATAPGVVSASRSSWNPNIMPFFALLSVFSLSQAVAKNKPFWFVLAGIAYGIAIQSHYLGLIIGPVLAAATMMTLPLRKWIKAAVLEIAGLVLGASMFLAFELRHAFPNIKTIFEFISRGGDTTGPRSWNLIWLFAEMTRRTFESVLPQIGSLTKLVVLASLFGLAVYVYLEKKTQKKLSIGTLSLLTWLIVGEFGVGVYKGQLYPHYFGFLFPLPFIILSLAIGLLLRLGKTKLVGIGIALIFLILNLSNQKIWGQGSNLIDQTKNAALEIIELSHGKPFNFALIANGNSDHAYRFFLEILDHRPTTLEEEVTEQLIVVCENPNIPCEPLGHPLWEIAGFGRAQIDKETLVHPQIKITRLIHHEDFRDYIGKPAPKGG